MIRSAIGIGAALAWVATAPGASLASTLIATSMSISTGATSISTSSTTSSSGATSIFTSSKTSSSGSASSSGSGASTANCTMPPLSTPFAGYGDSNLYAAVPGNAFDSFTATGWTMSGGASIKSAILADGTSGSVLDLPVGSQAVSPPMCVQYDYPNARMMVHALSGNQGITLLAAYLTSSTSVATSYTNTSLSSAWALSPVLQTHPGNQSGWQLVVFTIKPPSTSTDTQIYNFFVDPRMH